MPLWYVEAVGPTKFGCRHIESDTPDNAALGFSSHYLRTDIGVHLVDVTPCIALCGDEAVPSTRYRVIVTDSGGKVEATTKCKTCDGLKIVNTFNQPVRESNALENWPGPCPDCAT